MRPAQVSEVWYVGNLSGTVEIPAFWGSTPLSDWTLFRGEGTPPPVPDGGATVMLLGAAIGALGIARPFLIG